MKSLYEQKGGSYLQVGEYLLPNLVMDDQPEGEVGIWGWRRKEYLKKRKPGTYNAMLMQGTLTQHLIDSNEAALDMMEMLVKQMADAEGVTEELKRRDQMAWVRAM
ncbi:MAG: TnpV protein, partial [Clostridia bacterium]|nr:TnpV protein [Clostridia bacterium]